MAPPRKKRSKAWLYFTRKDDNIATCNGCKVSISSKGGTTSHMQKHLATQHAINLQECSVFDTLPLSSDVCESSSSEAIGTPSNINAEVDVVLEGDSNTHITGKEADLNGLLGASPESPSEPETQEEAFSDRPKRSRKNPPSLIWRHFERLDSLGAARCCICMKKLQCFRSGSTSNLHRHMAKRHPGMYTQLESNGHNPPQSSKADAETFTLPEKEKRRVQGGALKVSRASAGERRLLCREQKLIEAQRRAQREEAKALELQRELLEQLRAVHAREAAAEREQIETLRRTQLEEAKELNRQREELQKEKAELLLLSREQKSPDGIITDCCFSVNSLGLKL